MHFSVLCMTGVAPMRGSHVPLFDAVSGLASNGSISNLVEGAWDVPHIDNRDTSCLAVPTIPIAMSLCLCGFVIGLVWRRQPLGKTLVITPWRRVKASRNRKQDSGSRKQGA